MTGTAQVEIAGKAAVVEQVRSAGHPEGLRHKVPGEVVCPRVSGPDKGEDAEAAVPGEGEDRRHEPAHLRDVFHG